MSAASVLTMLSPVGASHQEGHERHAEDNRHETLGSGHPVPGASFQVYMEQQPEKTINRTVNDEDAQAAVNTVIEALSFMIQHRADYPRFDEAVAKQALEKVVIEPTVVNQEGKEFPFLVARTKEPGRVKLLISASALQRNGQLGHPETLVPVLAREFQWVVSKADTSPKPKSRSIERDLVHAPIHSDAEILSMSGDERARTLQHLFGTYLTTVDDQRSLVQQPYYETGTTRLLQPEQPDSTVKFYDIRVREALKKIVQDPYFQERMTRAVRSLLNGKVWNIAFVKVDQRDWATRTRVAPEDQAVVVGTSGLRVQPAKILINTYRTASPDDPFYPDTKGLPMGALSADQLARVIAAEIEQNIIEKSMTGHVAQDAMTAPK
ncbi:MAG TPA: hypothetical protein VJ746_12530 [Nitrospira sp.]|nr:hypothetical protein [Nitrospira sp.]